MDSQKILDELKSLQTEEKIKVVVSFLSSLTAGEIVNFTNKLCDNLGISASDLVSNVGGSSGAAPAIVAEESGLVDLVLTGLVKPELSTKAILALKEYFNGLQPAKEKVSTHFGATTIPLVLKTGIEKKEAESLVEKLKEIFNCKIEKTKG